MHFAKTEKKGYSKIMAKAMVDRSTVHRDVVVGQTIQEIPELKEAKASKIQILAIAQRKPKERELTRKTLPVSSNKPETVSLPLLKKPGYSA